jgi:hypothetical protein
MGADGSVRGGSSSSDELEDADGDGDGVMFKIRSQ